MTQASKALLEAFEHLSTPEQQDVTIPRHNPVNAFTMGAIVQDAGLTPEEFRELL